MCSPLYVIANPFSYNITEGLKQSRKTLRENRSRGIYASAAAIFSQLREKLDFFLDNGTIGWYINQCAKKHEK